MDKRKNDKKPVGRTVKTISLRMEVDLAEAIRADAAANDQSVSQWYRGAIKPALVEAGLWP